jgi:predicted phosphate transport protein (TIGR00153 family)
MGLREILIPQDKVFFESFTHQANNILLASQKLSAAFDARTISIDEARKEIRQIEHENDQLVHSMYDRLNESFVTPIDSNDILKLSSDYDSIIDFIWATINRYYLYKISSPDETMKKFSQIIVKCAEEIVKLTSAMTGRQKPKRQNGSAEEIDRLENEGDEILNMAVAKLFDEKKDALEVMKLKEIYEHLEETTDKYEDAALLIRDIALRYS